MERVRAHVLALAALAMLVMAVWQPPFLAAAEQQNRAVLASAVAAYAVLRTINATVSVAKETTVGVGLQAKPGMVLDPIDDTVRRVADAVFVVAAVSGFLGLAMAPMCSLGASLAAVGLGGLYAARFVPAAAGAWCRACRSLAAVGLALGLLFPMGYGIGGWIGDAMTADRLDGAMARLASSETTLGVEADSLMRQSAVPDDAPDRASQDASGMIDGTLRWLNDRGTDAMEGASGLFGQARAMVLDLGQIAEQGERILTSSIDIMAVYALRLVVFPFLTMFVFYVCARAALSGGRGGLGGP